jgi:hypothetical protein
VVEYWESFASHAFENTTQSVYSHCVLLKPSGAPVPATFCFSIRRDLFDLPSMVIGMYHVYFCCPCLLTRLKGNGSLFYSLYLVFISLPSPGSLYLCTLTCYLALSFAVLLFFIIVFRLLNILDVSHVLHLFDVYQICCHAGRCLPLLFSECKGYHVRPSKGKGVY